MVDLEQSGSTDHQPAAMDTANHNNYEYILMQSLQAYNIYCSWHNQFKIGHIMQTVYTQCIIHNTQHRILVSV